MGVLRLYSYFAIFALVSIFAGLTLFAVHFFHFTVFESLFTIVFELAINVGFFLASPKIIDKLVKPTWIDPDSISVEFGAWYRHSCRQLNIAEPRLGICEWMDPNAFTYGRTTKDARVVLTRGLLRTLEAKEIEAVTAHEFAHVYHRDFIAMSLVSAILGCIYVVCRILFQNSNAHAKGAGAISYVFYWAGYLCQLGFSRIREYYADREAAEITEDPSSLAKALVKISYGLSCYRPELDKPEVLAEPSQRRAKWYQYEGYSRATPSSASGSLQAKSTAKTSSLKSSSRNGIRALGICSATNERKSSYWMNPDGSLRRDCLNTVAAWDYRSPWAFLTEAFSTHPSISKRVDSLMSLDKGTRYFDRAVGSTVWKWSQLTELLVFLLPVVLPALVFTAIDWRGNFGLALLIAALSFPLSLWARLSLSVPTTNFTETTVANLLHDVEVGPVFARRAKLHGRLSDSGEMWSRKNCLDDQTGSLKLSVKTAFGQDRNPNFSEFEGKDVIVSGAFRRGGIPVFEVVSMRCTETGREKTYLSGLGQARFLLGFHFAALALIGAMVYSVLR